MVITSSSLPRLGLGMAALGRPGYINLDRSSILGTERTIDTMQSQANLVMDQLFQLSSSTALPWLDCARSYGLSEKFVGEYLRSNKIAPDDVHVSSKWGYTYVAEWNIELNDGQPHEVKDHSVENFLKQVEQTAECLGEYVDLYQVHSATFDSGILANEEVHAALSKCRRERGWKLGLSVSGPQQNDVLREAMKLKAKGENIPLFDSVQCTFNVLEQRPADALLEARESGMDIIIKEGLANGRALRHPSVLDYSEQLECSPDALALGCILAQPFSPRVLSGAVTAGQLASNFDAYKVAEKLQENDSALLEEIMASTLVATEDYWAERSALKWN
mmetsp:Transcript_8040/g.13312  ORF Transcript_8040/g.13312 Transcript_8040/m.13312 type:complete len:333 (-) Transcript_8040:57-1055(-)|eukprot:CAMPEP_0119010570 /NCGR_PEP_ID=MMETSP1176-20130426/5098_1 /TAXON_ID=265551 /ORGANISM="Synedropsis recta cf, Strain CCMP1620" /LENGTH=332 /DNA_ID=CAMNT_0006963253 /DNA_START=77 /DNA_END=1075 /DNA_ORIENTATION=-